MARASYDFHERVAIVTGGAQGIGLAVVRRLLECGAKVAILDRLAPKATNDLPDSSVLSVCVDVTDADAMKVAARAVAERFGGIDILVNSAGIAGPNATLWRYEVAEWRRVVDIDLIGTFLACHVCVPHMLERGWGRIVNIASIAGKEGNPNASAYSAAKAGVLGMTKSLGKELAGTQIRVNAITPAAVRTSIFDQMTQQHIDMMLSKIPLGRFGTVEEIAAMCVWLCSEECSFSTGATFDVSGGRAVY
jgi:2-dehydro-3-deoxy-L-rhamnonate dehydrogenase (NAD+)